MSSNSGTGVSSPEDYGDANASGKLPVIEIFGPTVQGEGALVGMPTHFVRLGGCPYRCKWCDSMHAVDPDQVKANARWMEPFEIMQELHKLSADGKGLVPGWLTISGGDPVIWDCYELVMKCIGNFRVAVETEGFMYRPWLTRCHLVTVSPKPPSSGMADKLDMEVLRKYVQCLGSEQLAFKVVVFNRDDFHFASYLRGEFRHSQFYLSVGTDPDPQGIGGPFDSGMILERYKWVVELALRDPNMTNVRVFPQMHVLLWGHEKGR